MYRPQVLLLTLSAAVWLASAPTAQGHGCGHHGGCGPAYSGHRGCQGCNWWSGDSRWSNPAARPERNPGAANRTNTLTREGKIAEVVYLPGVTADAAMVEIRLLSGNETITVRLGPAGFLKQRQLGLKEGDGITVTGYMAAGGEGDLLIASEVSKQGRTVEFRDGWGRPRW